MAFRWSRLWPGGILGGHSGYIWRPGSVPFIMGPYDSTNGLSLEQGELYKNRWNRWHFIDTDQGGEELVDSFGTPGRKHAPERFVTAKAHVAERSRPPLSRPSFTWQPAVA